MFETVDYRKLYYQGRLSPSEEMHRKLIKKFLLEMEVDEHPEFSRLKELYENRAKEYGISLDGKPEKKEEKKPEVVVEEVINEESVPSEEPEEIKPEKKSKKSSPKKK